MKHLPLSFLALCLLSACGHTTYLTVDCSKNLSAETLTQPCQKPVLTPDGTLYEAGLKTSGNEKTALAACGVKVEALQKAFADCKK